MSEAQVEEPPMKDASDALLTDEDRETSPPGYGTGTETDTEPLGTQPKAATEKHQSSQFYEAAQEKNRAAGRLNIYVEWKDLRFEAPDQNGETKQILQGLNGRVMPGELVAVIGPSGSGKSSFLNAIAGRIVIGVSGDIRFNGVDRPPNLARFSGYVCQDEVYLESLTVKEILRFAARLKLNKAQIAQKSIEERVDELITELDLQKCCDTRVGVVGKGISGGERRRLAIALEIINEPRLLLLDEPTSGLDAASALMVGKILLKLAHVKGITVLCSIHQPRAALGAMFDRLYFLGAGKELYFGPSIPYCLPFFEQCGFKCPPMTNPADFLLDLVNTSEAQNGDDDEDESAALAATIDMAEDEADVASALSVEAHAMLAGKTERLKIIEKIATEYANSELKKKATKQIEMSEEEHGSRAFAKSSNESFYITPVANQIWVVCVRSFLHKIREPISVMTQAFNSIIMPLLFGSIYFQMDRSQQGATDRLSAISLIVLMIAFFAFDVLLLFPSEREIYNREQAAGMYRPISFYIGRTLSEVPQHTVLSFAMGAIAYGMYGLQSKQDRFWTFILIAVLETSAGAGLLLLFGAMSANLEQSNLLATVFILIFMLFDGNWINLKQVPVYWRWVRWISYISYAGNAAMYNEYHGLNLRCSASDEAAGECYYHDGDDVLKQRNIENTSVVFCIIMLVVLNVIYRVLAFFAVWLLHRPFPPMYIIRNTFGFEN